MFLVSACLAGVNCRYDGSNNQNKIVSKLVNDGKAIPVCPEVIAGLNIPRPCCEIKKNENNQKIVVNELGQDLTAEFIESAHKCLEIVKTLDINKAILKAKSPSCGYGQIYDGTFSGNLIKGNGITAELLTQNSIKIYTENDLNKLDL